MALHVSRVGYRIALGGMLLGVASTACAGVLFGQLLWGRLAAGRTELMIGLISTGLALVAPCAAFVGAYLQQDEQAAKSSRASWQRTSERVQRWQQWW